VQGFDFVSWYGLWGPKNLPPNVLETLQTGVGKVLAQPDVKERFQQLGFEPLGMRSEGFASYIRSEMARAENIIAQANIKAE
jgi:tripartite-type tricarboxylate transporter receptor subunit TctC